MSSPNAQDPFDDTGYWAAVAADELSAALIDAGIGFGEVMGDEDGVTIMFEGREAAEQLVARVIGKDRGPGSLYDRAASSCVTLSALARDEAERGDEPFTETEAEEHERKVTEAFRVGWVWTVHPHMSLGGDRFGWHVTVEMPAYDANAITATLNAARIGGVA